MSIKKTQFKLELILLVCVAFLVIHVMPEVKEELKKQQWQEAGTEKEQEEQVCGTPLVVEYATGSDALLNKEAGIYIPTPTILPTPVPAETPVPTFVPVPETTIRVADLVGTTYMLEELQNLEYLKNKLYIVNSTTKMTEAEFDMEYFISRDFSVERSEEPQILIFHTHGSEGFANSRAGEPADTIVGAGELLAQFLREKYGYQVLHDTTIFDRKNGKDNRNNAYNEALDYLERLLERYPTIEVVIDLHRDAGTKRVVTIDGKPTAKVMLFNGLCRNTQGKLAYLPNDNLKDNLAFSFQMKLIGDVLYPGLMNRIFLKDYRYNMHLAERYLLIELGTEQNTVEEAKNAMEPLADVLAQVLGG